MTIQTTGDNITENYKDKNLLAIHCNCGYDGYIAINLNKNSQTVCPKCNIKYFYMTCEKCKTGYTFPDFEKKEFNFQENWWLCSFCRKKWQENFKLLPLTKWIDKTVVPEKIIKEKLINNQVYKIMMIGFLIISFVIFVAPITRSLIYNREKRSSNDIPTGLNIKPTDISQNNIWKSDFIDGVSFQYPSDFSIKKQENKIFEAENKRMDFTIERKEIDNFVLKEIEGIKTDIEKNPNSSTTIGSLKLSRYTAYYNGRMSAEGIFFNNYYIPLNDKEYILLFFSVDTRKDLNKKPEIYTEISKIAKGVLNTFQFTDMY